MPPEVVARSPSHFLTRDEEGWALWATDHDSDDPLLTFAPDVVGEERARFAFRVRSRETRLVRILGFAAIVAGGVWLAADILSFALTQILAAERARSLFDPADMPFWETVSLWLGATSALTGSIFQVAVGSFIVAWLQRRWRREG